VNPSLTPDQDPFKAMLVWSIVGHIALFSSLALAGHLTRPTAVLPTPDVAWIVPGSPGPGTGFGGGGSPAPKKPEPPPEPPEPKKSEPRVVRPSKEERDQLPMPDAPERRSKKSNQKRRSSGLIGRDSASAPSAQLKGVGVPGLGLGGSGGGSAFDQDFEYSYYVQQMLARINQHWQRVPVRGQAVVLVEFTIFKDGHLENVQIEQSSGIAMLDRAAERAVLLANPLPMLPNSYPRDRVGVHLQFLYSDQY
jgi:TonB family protein